MDLNKDADTNHDGKLRLATELDPNSLFDVAGDVKAGFHIIVHVGVTIPTRSARTSFVGVSHDLGGDDVTVFQVRQRRCQRLPEAGSAPRPAAAGARNG